MITKGTVWKDIHAVPLVISERRVFEDGVRTFEHSIQQQHPCLISDPHYLSGTQLLAGVSSVQERRTVQTASNFREIHCTNVAGYFTPKTLSLRLDRRLL